MAITASWRDKKGDQPRCLGCGIPKFERDALAEAGIPMTDQGVLAPLEVTGSDFGIHLCVACGVKTVQALGTMLALQDPGAKRELTRFFRVPLRAPRKKR